MMLSDVFYFGCGTVPGHYWWAPGTHPRALIHASIRTDASGRPGDCPFGYDVDGGYQPGSPARTDRLRRGARTQVQGEARLTHEKMWTALGWWDRSVDQRPDSCSTIVMRGTHEFDAMLEALGIHFPWVRDRQPSPIVVVERKGHRLMLPRKREALRRLGNVTFEKGDRVLWTSSERQLVGTVVSDVRCDEQGEYVQVRWGDNSLLAMTFDELEHVTDDDRTTP